MNGNVTNSGSLLGTGGFWLADHSGRILVLTTQAVPSEGQNLSVRGGVEQLYRIAGHEMVVIMEHDDPTGAGLDHRK